MRRIQGMRIRMEELADIYSSLKYYAKYYDDAENEVQTVLQAIEDTYKREYPDAELDDGFVFYNRRNAGRKSKLSPDDRKQIALLRKQGVPVEQIAEQFNLEISYVYKIIRKEQGR